MQLLSLSSGSRVKNIYINVDSRCKWIIFALASFLSKFCPLVRNYNQENVYTYVMNHII